MKARDFPSLFCCVCIFFFCTIIKLKQGGLVMHCLWLLISLVLPVGIIHPVSQTGIQKVRGLLDGTARFITQETDAPVKIEQKYQPSQMVTELQRDLERIKSAIIVDAKTIHFDKKSITRYVQYDKQLVAIDTRYAQKESLFSDADKDALDATYRATIKILANAVISLAISGIKKVQELIHLHVNDVKTHIIGVGDQKAFLYHSLTDDQNFIALANDIEDIVSLCYSAIMQEGNLLFSPEVYSSGDELLKQECHTLLIQLLSDNQTESLSFFSIVHLWHRYFFENVKGIMKNIDAARVSHIVQLLQTKVLNDIVEPIVLVWQLMMVFASSTVIFPGLGQINAGRGQVLLDEMQKMLIGANQKQLNQQTAKKNMRAQLLAESKKQLLAYKRTMTENARAIWQRDLEALIAQIKLYDVHAAEQLSAFVAQKKEESIAAQKSVGFVRQHVEQQKQEEYQKQITALIVRLKKIGSEITQASKNSNLLVDQSIDYAVYDAQLYAIFNEYQAIESNLTDQQVNQLAGIYHTVSVQLSTVVIDQAVKVAARLVDVIQEEIAQATKLCSYSAGEQQNFLNTHQAILNARADNIKKIIALVHKGVLQEKQLAFSASVIKHASQEELAKLSAAISLLVDARASSRPTLSGLLQIWYHYCTETFVTSVHDLPLIKRNMLKKTVGAAINDAIIEPLAALILNIIDAVETAQLPLTPETLQTDTLYEQLLAIERVFKPESASAKTTESLNDLLQEEQAGLTKLLDTLLHESYPANQQALDAWRQKAQKQVIQLKNIDTAVADVYQQRIDRFVRKATQKIVPTLVIKPSLT